MKEEKKANLKQQGSEPEDIGDIEQGFEIDQQHSNIAEDHAPKSQWLDYCRVHSQRIFALSGLG